jgi:hypothetical protein
MDMVAGAAVGADGGRAVGDDRYLVHVVRTVERPEMALADGSPLPVVDGLAIGCDCSTVEHTVGASEEPLSVGRRTRSWNTFQRRAISVRDGGHCRFPGCAHRFVDIHHLQPWERGGATDVANGCYQCRSITGCRTAGTAPRATLTLNFVSTGLTAATWDRHARNAYKAHTHDTFCSDRPLGGSRPVVALVGLDTPTPVAENR